MDSKACDDALVKIVCIKWRFHEGREKSMSVESACLACGL